MSDSAYTFELAWRWTQPSHNVLPLEVMAQIVPVESVAAPAGLTVRDQLDRAQLTDIQSTNARDIEDARRWLRALPVGSAERIVVRWGPRLAVQTTWEVFTRYWDDFCYPSSDDVEVFPPTRGWILLYHHWDLLEWGRSLIR